MPSLRGGRREEGERGVDGWMDGWTVGVQRGRTPPVGGRGGAE